MEELIRAMKVVLGTAFALYTKTHACHWNVEGFAFPALHPFFEMMYQDIWQSLDDIAEKIRQLDAYAPASLERFIELSQVKCDTDVPPAQEMILRLYKDNETMLAVLTEAFHHAEHQDQQGLANFLAERMEAHSKWRWQLRATAKRV